MKLSSNNESGETGGRMPAVSVIDPAPRPTRRTFTGAYKLATVAEYEAAPHGQERRAAPGGAVSLAHRGVGRGPRRRGAVPGGEGGQSRCAREPVRGGVYR